jgi:uncharacterized protein YfaS (alpha-2-macroglobulin family)
MKQTKKQLLLIVAVVLILFSSLFCSIFQPESDVVETEITITVEAELGSTSLTPTLLPTNMVILEDDGDPLSPNVINTFPSGGQEIGEKSIIEIQFDQQMDQNATSAAWELLNPQGNSVEGKVTWPQPDTLHFSPNKPLSTGTIYRGYLSNGAKSSNNIALSEPYYFDVLVASNLIVSQVFPADGTLNVENDAVITIIFNRPVVPLSSVEDQVGFQPPIRIHPSIKGRGEWINTSVYVFRTEEAFASLTEYTVLVEAGLVDTIGSTLRTDFEWRFTTAAPSVSSFGINGPISGKNPKDNFEDVRLESSFVINFHQPMDEDSFPEAFSLYSLQGEKVSTKFEWKTENQVYITPTRPLSLGTDYTFLLSQEMQASSGGTLEEDLRWNFRTVPFPTIEATYPEDGDTQIDFSNRFSLMFSSPMDLDTIADRVKVAPKPEGELTWYYDAWGWRVDFYGLEPSTNYSVSVEQGVEDIYGNQIDEDHSFSFRTGSLRPGAYLDLPYAPSIYRLGGPMNFYVSYVNVDVVDVDLYKIPAAFFAGFNNGTYRRWDYVPPDESWVNSWRWENTKSENKIVRQSAGLRKASGDALEPGFYFMTINSDQVQKQNIYLDTRLLVVAESNLTFKTTQTEGLMWLTDLDSGDPLNDVSLVVFDQNFNQIGTGATNNDGLLYLTLPEPEEIYFNRYVMTEEGEPFGFAISEWGSGASPYEFGIWSSYYTLPDQPMAYVYTDKPIYRPGQIVPFKGIVRQNDDLSYDLLPWDDVVVEINSYNDSVFLEELQLSEYGTFDGEFTLDENAALGYYAIQVLSPINGDSIGGVSFSVAEYRKPEFQVTTNAEPGDVLDGNQFTVVVSAEYFSGGGVANAEVDWAIKSTDYYFHPSGELGIFTYTDFDRDTDLYFDYFGAPRSEIIATGKGQTDANGEMEIILSADISEAGNSRTLTFESTISDLAGTSISDRVNIIAHKAEVYPGVRPRSYVGNEGREQIFDIILLDWDENPLPGGVVNVEIVERRWYSVQEQDPQGFVRWKTSVEEIPVANFTDLQMDSRGRGIVNFTPEKGGIYKAKVEAIDDEGNVASSGAYMWISGSETVFWRQTNDRKIDLVIDKELYEPGETAEILIASPFEGDNYALVTVERGHIQQQDVIRLANNSSIYRLPISSDMGPNVYVSVLVIQGADVGGKPDFRFGLVKLNVALDKQLINLEIEPNVLDAGPGDEVTYEIKTTNNQGAPVSAEVSLALVDLAVLSLVEPNSRPILDYFYDQQSLSVRTAVPIVYSIEDYISSLEDRLTQGEGMGSGGGKGFDSFGVLEIRGDFKDTALWEAKLVTDKNGEASITVKLPDNLTIWRMDARAVSLKTLVGSGENDIRSTKPLLIRPQTPRFFVSEDRSTLGAAVHNNTDEELTIKVSLDASGVSLDTPAIQNIRVDAGKQAHITWDIKVDSDVDRVDLIFTATGGKYNDITRPTLGTLDGQGIPVYRYDAIESVGTAGVLSEAGSRTEGIHLPSSWGISQGDLTIKISPSLAAGMVDGLDYLAHYPYECIEQTISRFLPNVLTTQALKEAGVKDIVLSSNLEKQVNVALQRIYNWQRADGGWGWWAESQQSDPLTSAYVVLGLIEAQSAGYHINADTLTRSLNYLKGNLKSLGRLEEQFTLNRQTFILLVLARANQSQVSLTSAMYDVRQSLSLFARANLAETLWIIDKEDPRLDTLISDFNNAAIISASGAYWQEDWRDYRNWNTDTRTTAIILGTLLNIDPGNQLTPNIVRWLMTHRSRGGWRTTQETAWTLMSLTKWLEVTDELNANYDWAAGVNDTRVGDGSANMDTLQHTTEIKLDITELFLDEINRVTLARDDGKGNMYYTAHLNVYLPVDQIEPLDRGITISKAYYLLDGDDPNEPITRADQGDLLLSRLTIVVPHDLHYVVIDDPLPAGLEAVDPSIIINPDILLPKAYDFDTIWTDGWGWWYFDHTEYRDERVVISADYLPAGTYVYSYIVRASTPGNFHVIPSIAQEFYFPDVYGRSAGGKFIVDP